MGAFETETGAIFLALCGRPARRVAILGIKFGPSLLHTWWNVVKKKKKKVLNGAQDSREKNLRYAPSAPPPGSKNTAWASRAALWRDFRAPTPAGERNTEVTIYNPQLFFFFFSKAAQLRACVQQQVQLQPTRYFKSRLCCVPIE